MVFHATLRGRLSSEAARMRLTLASNEDQACVLDHVAKSLRCGDVRKGARSLVSMSAYVVLPELAISNHFAQMLRFSEYSSLPDRTIDGVACYGVRFMNRIPGGEREVHWWFGKQDHLPREQLWMDRLDGLEGAMRFTLSGYETQLRLPDAAFGIAPPSGVEAARDEGPFIAEGRLAPNFNLTGVDGERLSLRELRGRPVLLYFWMPACGYCKAIEPQLVALAKQLDAQRLDAVRLGNHIVPMDEEQLQQYFPPSELGMTLVLDAGASPADYRVFATPALTLIDAEGVIRFDSVGAGPTQIKELSQLMSKGRHERAKTQTESGSAGLARGVELRQRAGATEFVSRPERF